MCILSATLIVVFQVLVPLKRVSCNSEYQPHLILCSHDAEYTLTQINSNIHTMNGFGGTLAC